MPASDPSKLLQPLEAVMREAGALARDVAQKPFKHWTKGPEKSPVTEGDIAVLARTRTTPTFLTWSSAAREQ